MTQLQGQQNLKDQLVASELATTKANENFHKTAKSYVEREKVIDREPISGIRSMLPYPCYDYTCVELLKAMGMPNHK